MNSDPLHRLAISLAALLLLTGCGKDVPEKSAEARPRLFTYQYGDTIRFGFGGDSERFRLTGWGETEPGMTWTDGIAASLNIRVPPTTCGVKFQLKASGMHTKPRLPFQPLDVSIHGEVVAHWEVDEEKIYAFDVPPRFVSPTEERLWTIDFYIPKAQSPANLGLNADPRRLGLRCVELVITACTP